MAERRGVGVEKSVEGTGRSCSGPTGSSDSSDSVMFTVTGLHSSTIGDGSHKSSRWTRWWVIGGCLCLAVTLAFVATTVYLGTGTIEIPVRVEVPPRPAQPPPPHTYNDYPFPSVKHKTTNKATIQMVTLEEARQKDAFEEDFKVPSDDGLNILPKDSLEEMYESGWPDVKESPSRKKSEAVLPHSVWPEPSLLGEPVVVDPQNDFAAEGDFKLPGFGQRETSQRPRQAEGNGLAEKAYDRLREAIGSAGGEWANILNGSLSVTNFTSAIRSLYSEPESTQRALNDTSSLASFAMLAVDLFLLHSVQRVALADPSASETLRTDPEVVALDALFAPKHPQVQEARTADSSPVLELVDTLGSFLRAVVNMIKVYSASTSPGQRGKAAGASTLDCLWTLYCRNLDKMAKVEGPYGLLAKVNSKFTYKWELLKVQGGKGKSSILGVVVP
ncbi:hypothetical protein AAG570_002927 [Ranatra chinensis]|uniref:Uncharacterized protein n=1 Tax=Ranatra chinensis TaxID=642074 RepID=A0ABD0Y5Q9_9HEMI